MWHEPARGDRQSARGDDGPRDLAGGEIALVERTIAVPRALHARLASCVCKLYCRHGAELSQEIGDALEWRNLTVVPQAEVAVRNPATFVHGSCLGEHQTCAAHRKFSKVHKMEIAGQPVAGRVLAHRRNRQTVAQFDRTQPDGSEEQWSRHGGVCVVKGLPVEPAVRRRTTARRHAARRSPAP